MTQPDTIGEGWQDIASAPTGEDIDLWVHYPRLGRGERITDCRFTGSHWILRSDETGWVHLIPDSVPTHWMPLPNPPASATDAPYPGRGHSTSPRTSSGDAA